MCVVATTHQNSTRSILTSVKLTIGYLVVGIYKRTRQGALAALLLYLYKYNVVRATTMCLPPVLLLIYHASTSRPPCLYLKATMSCLCALTSYSLISITMCAPCVYHEEPLSLDIIPNPNSF